MLEITEGARKKGKPRMRWMEGIKSITGLSVNNLNQLVIGRKTWISLVNNIVKKRKRTNVYSKKKATAIQSFGDTV